MKSAVLFSMVVAAVLMCLSVPLSAQEGRDLLAWNESPSEHVFVKEAVGDVVVYGADDINLVDATASEPTGVASAATTEYKYDDGTPEAFTRIADAHEQEYAQRFRLPRAGTVASATACFGRDQDDNDANVSFVLTFYRDTGGRPGNRLASYSASASGLTRDRGTCVGVSQGDITRQRLESGDTWLSVSWLNSSGKFFAEDHNGPGGTGNFWRARSSAGGSWSSWNAETVATAYFIRLGVDHGGSTPPPPDPDPPPTPGCTPTTTVLSFDGGYDVSMCYRTPEGVEGQAKSGIWASGESGLLWFFSRDNAEVLVKVLNGCSHNGYRWVFVAPVTTVEFNLRVTGPDGKRWTHSNQQGMTAATKSDTAAFRCADEPDDGGDDGDDDGGDDGDDDGGDDGDDDGGDDGDDDGGDDGDDDDDDDGDGEAAAPDLVVSSPSVSDSSLAAGGSFTFRATVRNQGDAQSASTTLRYYRSSDSTISSSDTPVGTDAVGALAASGTSAESIVLTAPSTDGTYYYGACVESVSGESDTGNNCSTGVRVAVEDALTLDFECSAGRVGASISVTIDGTVQANRALYGLVITGYADTVRFTDVETAQEIGTQSLGDFRAGQSKDFSITGTIPDDASATSFYCAVASSARTVGPGTAVSSVSITAGSSIVAPPE